MERKKILRSVASASNVFEGLLGHGLSLVLHSTVRAAVTCRGGTVPWTGRAQAVALLPALLSSAAWRAALQGTGRVTYTGKTWEMSTTLAVFRRTQKRRTTHLVRNEAGNNLCISRNVVALFFLSAFWQEGP